RRLSLLMTSLPYFPWSVRMASRRTARAVHAAGVDARRATRHCLIDGNRKTVLKWSPACGKIAAVASPRLRHVSQGSRRQSYTIARAALLRDHLDLAIEAGFDLEIAVVDLAVV